MTDANAENIALIVGAGHAAGECATAIRDQGWMGRIVMVGEERHLPYQRPPLSKAFLSGESTADMALPQISHAISYRPAFAAMRRRISASISERSSAM